MQSTLHSKNSASFQIRFNTPLEQTSLQSYYIVCKFVHLSICLQLQWFPSVETVRTHVICNASYHLA